MQEKLDQYENLLQEIEAQKRNKAMAEGALAQNMAKLQKTFKCGTLEEAEELHATMKEAAEDAWTDFSDQLDRFMERWQPGGVPK